MSPRERLAAAMSLQTPDRVPVMCQMSIGHMLLQTGLSPLEFWHSAEIFAEGLASLRQAYGFDGILVSLYGHDPDWQKALVRVERTDSGEIAHWKSGDATLCLADDLPRFLPAQKPVLPDLAALDPESIPLKISHIPVSQGLRFELGTKSPYRVFDILRESLRGEFSLHGEVTSPFDYFLDLLGFEQGLTALLDDPARSRAILQRFTEGIKELGREQCRHGVDAIKISSPYAGAGYISPAFYREFVLPFESQVVRALRDEGVHVYLHTCGSIGDRLEMMAESGASGVECLDPPPLGNINLAEAKERVGRRMFIKGNIDPVHVLLHGTPEVVLNDARERVRVGKPGGGYILSTACSIAPRTKREHVALLLRAVEESGGYP